MNTNWAELKEEITKAIVASSQDESVLSVAVVIARRDQQDDLVIQVQGRGDHIAMQAAFKQLGKIAKQALKQLTRT